MPRENELMQPGKFTLTVALLFLTIASTHGQHLWSTGLKSAHSETRATTSLQDLVNKAAHTALTKFADQKLTEDQLSITLIDLRDPQHPLTASFRGNERVYPASVVKLFYFVAVHRWLEDKKIQETVELK